MNLFQIKRYAAFMLKPNHWKGFGIHSPFIFDLITNTFRVRHEYYAFGQIRSWRDALLRNRKDIAIRDYGAGSKVTVNKTRRVQEIAKHSTIPEKYGQLLFKMACKFKAENILELGTSLGIGTLYLAMPNSKSRVITIEGCKETASIASHTFEQIQTNNVELITGTFNERLPEALEKLQKVDMVFFDGDHREQSTLAYFTQCLPYAHNDSIFIFDDIHWSAEMEKAWNQIVNHPQVTVSLDLMRLGIIFFRKESKKEHFAVRV